MGLFTKEDKNANDFHSSEIEDLRQTILRTKMPKAVEDLALKEIDKLERTGPFTAEYTIGTNYLTYLTSLPWNSHTEDNLDIKRAKIILDEDHYGLDEIKDRILEHLAVRILKLFRKPSVLVVDDEKTARTHLGHALSKEGYQVSTAGSGTEAIEMMDQIAFDAILTDLKMEKVDGMAVLERAKQIDPTTAVVMITGYGTVSTAIEAMKKGSYHFLPKPLKLDEIRTVLRRALDQKKSRLESRGPVLCFVGPPGTGKTSLGVSIARCLEKRFIRISLAGMKDEAEIRGHRRSYVGALPGRIMQEIRRVESNNPLIMLDEIDKIGQDFKGDPGSALLEVLDPEQNSHFMDHYLDVPFDLSKAMFIATANIIGPIPAPLLDRLELLHLSGYTDHEKEKIAFKYLIPKEIENAGLTDSPPEFRPESLYRLIRWYTREAGLRDLQRQIASVCRKIARERLENEKKHFEIDSGALEKFLGPPRYHLEVTEAKDRIGVATGLAWTETGGQIMFIEATKMKGNNRLLLTGCLGDIMKESAKAALSYIRSHTGLLNVDEGIFESHDIHIHVPAGAIPKDGPSAGLPIAAALFSMLTGRRCGREIALTGEVTLTGRILRIGGIREKLLAAHRAGVKSVVYPAKNQREVESLSAEIKADLNLIPIDDLSEVANIVLR